MKQLYTFILGALLPAVSFSQGYLQHSVKDSAITSSLKASAPAHTQNFRFEQIVPRNYYTQHLGFFCRQELKMQQAKVPVTFRLGSMEQCNTLEQKPGYR